jgi:hypothetical protein
MAAKVKRVVIKNPAVMKGVKTALRKLGVKFKSRKLRKANRRKR